MQGYLRHWEGSDLCEAIQPYLHPNVLAKIHKEIDRCHVIKKMVMVGKMLSIQTTESLARCIKKTRSTTLKNISV